MNYILDTDILIYFLKGYPNVVARLANMPTNQLTTTIINHTELLFGAHHSSKKNQNLVKIQSFLNNFEILPFCDTSSHIFAEQKALLKKSGKLIDDFDLIIASIAIKHQYTLVTNNTRHFDRIKKLKLENWHQ